MRRWWRKLGACEQYRKNRKHFQTTIPGMEKQEGYKKASITSLGTTNLAVCAVFRRKDEKVMSINGVDLDDGGLIVFIMTSIYTPISCT